MRRHPRVLQAMLVAGDRIVTPRWFTTKIIGDWHTVSGSPARTGTLNVTQGEVPVGFGAKPVNVLDVDCRYSGHDAVTMFVTPALGAQLGFDAHLVGRTIAFDVTFQVHARTGTWLFPPKV